MAHRTQSAAGRPRPRAAEAGAGPTARFFAAAFFSDFGTAMYVVALPYLAMELGASSLGLGVIGAARGTSYLAGCLVAAFLADRMSRARLTGISCMLVVAAYALSSRAATLGQLTGAVAFWAGVLALFWPALFAWTADVHGAAKLGRATGAANMGWSLGYMFGGAAGGCLYRVSALAPVLLAAVPVLGAYLSLRGVSERRAERVRRPRDGRRGGGNTAGLLAGWIGNGSMCCLFGLMSGVFPKFGLEIGVGAAVFGLMMALAGLLRTGVFLASFFGSVWPRDWRVSVAGQLLAAALVGGVSLAGSPWVPFVAFAGVGLGVGLAFQASLHRSLEGEHARGMKSGLHEAALMGGVLLGTFGGGGVAEAWGLRAPYVPAAGLACLLAAVQVVLNLRARRG